VICVLQLARTGPEGFTPADFAAINLVIAQIALALDNLLACEEIDERRRQKTAELAVAGAFQNGKTMAEIVPAVAAAINDLMPGVDLLSIYQMGRWPVHRSMCRCRSRTAFLCLCSPKNRCCPPPSRPWAGSNG
jgi:hypothetical protein